MIVASRFGRLVSTWKVCRWVSAITAHIRVTKERGTRACATSLIEFTNTIRGVCHLSGSPRTSSWQVTPNPGPLGARVAVVLVFDLAHRLQPLGQRQRITVIASG